MTKRKIVLDADVIINFSRYCKENDITYLGTVDFLYYAVKNEIMTEEEATKSMNDMIAKGSRLPIGINFNNYHPTSIL